MAFKRRVTKFVTIEETSSISAKSNEVLCGVYSDFQDGHRVYAFEYVEESNSEESEEKEEKATRITESSGKQEVSPSCGCVIKQITIVQL